MNQFSDTLFPSIPSLLEALEEEGAPVPENLLYAVGQLKKRVQEALQGDEEQLEEALEALFPELWGLRQAAISFLADLEMGKAIRKIELDLQTLAAQTPQLKATVERLQFGLVLTVQFVQTLIANEPDIFRKVSVSGQNSDIGYQDVMAQLSATGNQQAHTVISFFHGSLMKELLLFALHSIAEGYAIPEKAMCHELQYLSAKAVKHYAAGLGVDQTQLPWYQPPKSDFQTFLLSGPVANTEHLRFIKEKRAQFNTWK